MFANPYRPTPSVSVSCCDCFTNFCRLSLVSFTSCSPVFSNCFTI